LIAKGVDGPKAPPSLWQISIVGGDARKLIDDASLPHFRLTDRRSWSREALSNEEIWVMQADGEKPRRLVAAARSMFITPAWSPDGKKIVCVTGT
jgi:hypothetical protein